MPGRVCLPKSGGKPLNSIFQGDNDMSKYQSYQKAKELPRNEIHPVWRGIGCVMIIITPVISWASAMLLLDFWRAQKLPYLGDLLGYLRFPEIVYKIPGISMLANYISSIRDLKALAVFFLLLLLTFSGILAVLNAVMYRIIGPPRYTAVDEPAPRVKTKKFTR
jgi:hypothetical protein